MANVFIEMEPDPNWYLLGSGGGLCSVEPIPARGNVLVPRAEAEPRGLRAGVSACPNTAAANLRGVLYARRIGAGMVTLAVLLYGGDWLLARWRGRAAFETVQVQPYYAVPLKDGKTEFFMLDPESRTCVHALFPHFGSSPCWYLRGHKEQRISM